MKKKTLRIIALVVMLTLTLAIAVSAAENASDYIAATSAWITRDGNTVEVNFYIIGTGTMDQLGLTCVDLYESVPNGWTLVKTFDSTDSQYHNTMLASNTGGHAGYLTYSGSASKSYYATCYFYAEKNGGSDTIPQNTPTSHGTTPPGP